MEKNTKRFLVFIALLCILFVLGDIFLWINITNQYSGSNEFREAYLQRYPAPIQNIKGLTIVPLLLLVFASLIFMRSVKTGVIKIIAATVFALLAIIIIWKIFVLL